MRKFFMFFFVFIVFANFSFSQDAKIKVSLSEKKKLLILPFEDNSDRKKFPASRESGIIMFNSLYYFIGILPQVEVTDKNVASKLNFKNNNQIFKYAQENDIDYVIYGEYSLSREKNDVMIQIDYKVWSKKESSNLVSVVYNSSAGLDIFDNIDEMIKKFLKDILKIDYQVAVINFKNFDIGEEKFSLYVNGSFLEEITNSNFNLSLKVLPRYTNIIEIKRKDGTNAIESAIFLRPHHSIDFSYTSMGTIKVNPIKLEERGRKYSFFIDGAEVDIIGGSKSIKAGVRHKVELKDDKGKTHLKDEFYLKDGEVKEYSPVIQNPGLFHYKAYTFDKEMLTLGVDIGIGRYFWVGAGSGVTYFQNENITFCYISPQVEAGYFFLNDRSYLWRVGGGVNFKYYYKLIDSLSEKKYIPEGIYSIGLFLNGEFSFVTFRPTVYFSFDDKDFYISFGLGFGVCF